MNELVEAGNELYESQPRLYFTLALVYTANSKYLY